MAHLIRQLTSVSPNLRSGPSPGRRLLAVVLCAALILGAVSPVFALAREADSEAEGTGAPIEVPLAPPDFEPGGEETELEEDAPAEGDEESGAVEAEAEAEVPAPESASEVPPEAPAEAVPPVLTAEPPTYAPAAEPTQPQAEAVPVEGQAIEAPPQMRTDGGNPSEGAVSAEPASPPQAPQPAQPAQEAPPPPRPVASTPAEPGGNLAGKDTYVVRPGDCLWQIAAGLLGPGADTQAIEAEVGRLWRLNEDRIGTGDPSLIYAGTELRLR